MACTAPVPDVTHQGRAKNQPLAAFDSITLAPHTDTSKAECQRWTGLLYTTVAIVCLLVIPFCVTQWLRHPPPPPHLSPKPTHPPPQPPNRPPIYPIDNLICENVSVRLNDIYARSYDEGWGGIYVHGFDEFTTNTLTLHGTIDAVNATCRTLGICPTRLAQQHGTVAFTHMRRDLVALDGHIVFQSFPGGFIFLIYDDLWKPLCFFPRDAYSVHRATFCSCGPVTSSNTVTAPCVPEAVSRHLITTPVSDCCFSAPFGMTYDAFAASLIRTKDHRTPKGKSWNEVMIPEWSHRHVSDLPLVAFFRMKGQDSQAIYHFAKQYNSPVVTIDESRRTTSPFTCEM